MKRTAFLLISLFSLASASAQKKDFAYTFYGFVRGDLFYNSRANVAPVDGNFYLYPMPEALDADGKDLNAVPNGSFYSFTTRLGLDVKGPNVGTARTAAKVETDFGGIASSTTMLRIRQAYVTLDWTKSQLLIGHTWHPLFGTVAPDILNLSTGAPFQPFNRSPLLRYQYKAGRVKLTAATVWQLQYLSAGPAGGSENYIKNGMLPELYAGADFAGGGWTAGAGAHLLSLKPRTSSAVQDRMYKVNERMTAVSYEAHLQYKGRNYTFAAKSLLAAALDQTALLGGYGISSIDPVTGRQEYTAFRHSTSWINATYGNKWRAGIFAGYTRNLGTGKALAVPTTHGLGLNIDKVYMVNPSFSYNLPHWKLGVEYCLASAYYGTNDLADGKVRGTQAATNHRILGLMMYYF
ncbi:hypothetical protein Barb6XT_00132 [Bacteroidales bacterium Barb6XT]|nr:hypothetical protein Barb6XT_00132 [Bacteroidales bacterium Barb6XT]